MFNEDKDSHRHSLETLESLYKHDDFMLSLSNVIDMGCGSGLDLQWWATRTTRDDTPIPLEIKCLGIDLQASHRATPAHPNIQYQFQNFEDTILVNKRKFDLIWCHDSFQYVINPFQTLSNWWKIMPDDGMLALILPQSTNVEFNRQAFDQRDGCYHNWTLVSLIHTLAVSGFDCNGGFFRKQVDSPWITAIVYKSKQPPMDPRTTRWYDLADLGLLPHTAVASVTKNGYLKQQDLVLPWLDGSLESYINH
jgi:ubiquinone/menaquinone biosynthesis C-methylase UbiE